MSRTGRAVRDSSSPSGGGVGFRKRPGQTGCWQQRWRQPAQSGPVGHVRRRRSAVPTPVREATRTTTRSRARAPSPVTPTLVAQREPEGERSRRALVVDADDRLHAEGHVPIPRHCHRATVEPLVRTGEVRRPEGLVHVIAARVIASRARLRGHSLSQGRSADRRPAELIDHRPVTRPEHDTDLRSARTHHRMVPRRRQAWPAILIGVAGGTRLALTRPDDNRAPRLPHEWRP